MIGHVLGASGRIAGPLGYTQYRASAWLHNGTWVITETTAVNTPTIGDTELLTDGGLENWTTPTNLTSWDEVGGGAVDQESVIIHGGTYAAKLSYSGAYVGISQSYTPAASMWVQLSTWARYVGALSVSNFRIRGYYTTTLVLSSSFARYKTTGWISAASLFEAHNSIIAGTTTVVDDLTARQIAVDTLFAVKQYASSDYTIDVAMTKAGGAANGRQSGIVANLDSVSNPKYYVVATHNGNGRMSLDKCVNGVISNVVESTVTYVAGKILRLVKSGTTYTVTYGGAAVGSPATISDVGIVSNTLHGMVSTGDSETLSGYSLT